MIIKWDYLQNEKTPKHQVEFHQDDATKFLHMSGGYGSGKSYGLIKKIFKLSWLNRNLPGGLMCPSYSDYKKDIRPAIEEILEKYRLTPFVKENKSDKTWVFPWSRAPLYVVTAEKKLKGPNWAYAGVNELTLCPFERYREVMARVRIKGAPCPQVASVGTYEGLYGEYDDFFWDSPNPHSRVIKASTRDNAQNLEEHYISMIESAYDSKMVQAYIDGERVNLLGNLFYYSYHPARNDVRGYKIPSESIGFLCSLDFNVDPFCAGLWVRDSKGVVAVDQVKLSGGTGYDTRQMVRALSERGYTPDNTTIYPDPAGNQRSTKGKPDIQVLREAGYEVIVKSAAPRLRQRQLNANNLLEKGIVRVDPDRAPDVKKDLAKVTQDKVTLEKIDTNQELTHFSDGMDYMLDIIFPWSGNRSRTEQGKLR